MPPTAVSLIWRTIIGVKFCCWQRHMLWSLNTIALHYTARAVWTYGGSELDKQTLLLVDHSLQTFFARCSRDCRRSSLFLVVDILIHFADLCGQILKLSRIACTVDFGWVHIGQRNFAVSGRKFAIFCSFFDSCRLSLFQIVDIWTHSRDICGRSQKLSQIAPNFGRFCSPRF